MGRTIKELSDKVWFRLLKVIYLALYLPYLLILYVVILEPGSSYRYVRESQFVDEESSPQPTGMEVPITAAPQPKSRYRFVDEEPAINPAEPTTAPSSSAGGRFYNPDEIVFDEPSPPIQGKGRFVNPDEIVFDDEIASGKIPPPGLPDYVRAAIEKETVKPSYEPIYAWKIKEAIYFFLVFSTIYLLSMETIKRAFYYVAIGKVFPKE